MHAVLTMFASVIGGPKVLPRASAIAAIITSKGHPISHEVVAGVLKATGAGEQTVANTLRRVG